MDNKAEFKAWLKRNRLALAKYSAAEIVEMAKLCGFEDEGMLFEVLSHYRDALNGFNTDNRANMAIEIFEYAVAERFGKIDLSQQWSELGDYLLHGTEFL